MNKVMSTLSRVITLKRTIIVGIVLLVIVAAIAAHLSVVSATQLAKETVLTLKQQCVSYNRLVAADRTKSLYRLSDMMTDLSEDLMRDPTIATDQYLESYVDSMRLSGVALLDGDGMLVASGYTRQFQDKEWEGTLYGNRFADIIQYPNKIYTERIAIDGEYYDICAVSRGDEQGILVGFYRQPSGLITETENDLQNLLNGLKPECGGQYVIAENGYIRVASDESLAGNVDDHAITKQLSDVQKDERLHLAQTDNGLYYGSRAGCEEYNLYVYYPVASVLSPSLVALAVFVTIYSVLCLVYFVVRSQALYENHEKLKKSNHDLTQTVEMLKALETIYFCIFFVDLDNDRYHTIHLAPWLQSAIPTSGVYTELKQMMLDTMAVPSFKETLDYRMSEGFIRENLNKAKVSDVRRSFYTDYQAIRGGEIRWCRITATAVDYDENGNLLHALALIQDINKEKKREADYQEQILREAEEVRIANEAKTEFLRRMSHDIRTPINGIQGYVDIALKHPDDAALQLHCQEQTKAALKILSELVGGMLDMSKLESNEIVLDEKLFDLSKLLDDVNAIILPQATARNVKFEMLRDGPVAVTHVVGSPRHVTQVIMNITANAVKYTNPEGYVRVNTHLVAQTADTVTYEFVCEDNGIGMGEEFQKHMFEPFTQEAISARSSYEGTGLGLSIAKQLVDVMGGTITCESQKDVGTTFRTRLTFAIDKQFEVPQTTTVTDQVQQNALHVLLAEDNELNMEVASFMLEEQGASVTKAWDGKQAAEMFSAADEGYFDLVLMDLMMPQMNGLQAAQAIRNSGRADAQVPIYAMSANAFDEDVQACLDVGMNGHIAKPIDPTKLHEVLAKCKNTHPTK